MGELVLAAKVSHVPSLMLSELPGSQLKGVREDVRDKILRNMSERASANLLEEIEMLGPVKLKTVEESQAGVVRIIRTLEESGDLIVQRGSDEYVV